MRPPHHDRRRRFLRAVFACPVLPLLDLLLDDFRAPPIQQPRERRRHTNYRHDRRIEELPADSHIATTTTEQESPQYGQ